MTDTVSHDEVQLIQNCQFGNWYKLFKGLTPRTRVLEAPEEFRQYLLSDGIHLPSGALESDDEEWETPGMEERVASYEPEDDSDEDDDEEDSKLPSIPLEFQQQIKDTIVELNGAVAPKLNWSAPRDAVWMSPTNDMKCINANDIYSLIKASDYCTHDLTRSLGENKGPEVVQLVFREWFDINPALEFRCFVKDKKLIAITQRDMNYYEFLYPLRTQFESLIQDFSLKLSTKYPDESFVFDIYIPRPFNKVWLIDINPFLERTDTLLFAWTELRAWDQDRQFRLVEKLDSTRGFGSVQHTTNYVPHDLVDMDKDSMEDLMVKLKESYETQIKEDKADSKQ